MVRVVAHHPDMNILAGRADTLHRNDSRGAHQSPPGWIRAQGLHRVRALHNLHHRVEGRETLDKNQYCAVAAVQGTLRFVVPRLVASLAEEREDAGTAGMPDLTAVGAATGRVVPELTRSVAVPAEAPARVLEGGTRFSLAGWPSDPGCAIAVAEQLEPSRVLDESSVMQPEVIFAEMLRPRTTCREHTLVLTRRSSRRVQEKVLPREHGTLGVEGNAGRSIADVPTVVVAKALVGHTAAVVHNMSVPSQGEVSIPRAQETTPPPSRRSREGGRSVDTFVARSAGVRVAVLQPPSAALMAGPLRLVTPRADSVGINRTTAFRPFRV